MSLESVTRWGNMYLFYDGLALYSGQLRDVVAIIIYTSSGDIMVMVYMETRVGQLKHNLQAYSACSQFFL